MNLRTVSSQVEAKLSEIFSEELTSGLAAARRFPRFRGDG